MKIKPLPSVGEVGKQAHLNGLEKAQSSKDIEDERTVLSYGYFSSLVGAEITQDRDLAYTSLIEGIEGMSMPIGSEGLEKQMYDQALSDIINKVIKPLYGKE